MISKQYLAGFTDGEGYISVNTHKDIRTKRGFTLHPRIVLASTNKILLNQIQEITKGKITLNTKTHGCKNVYVLIIQDLESILSYIKHIKKYLIIKSEQAKLIHEYCILRLKNKNKGYSDRELEIAKIFKKINKRGESQNT